MLVFLARYQWCAKRAWDSTLAWVAAVCSRSVEQLEQEYKDACANGLFDSGNELGAAPGQWDADEAEDSWQPPKQNSENPCLDLLKHVASEAQSWVGLGEAEEPDVAEQPSAKPDHAADLDGVPDRAELECLTAAKNSEEPFGTEAFGSPQQEKHKDENYLPKSLADVLTLKGNFWNKLLRFAVYLRCSPHGIDSGFVRNPLTCRKASRKLNWHQHLGITFFFVDAFLQKDLAYQSLSMFIQTHPCLSMLIPIHPFLSIFIPIYPCSSSMYLYESI